MAEWSHPERTLYTKIVYYGPALGGKTTNLQALHRVTDPRNHHKMLSVKTAEERTLFFDLLPFELGDILGYQVAMKVYTVPGPVRYEKTRKVVVADADAVVFVADSDADRCEQNVWSLQNLRMNLHERRSEPSRVPILFQFNKQDLPNAVTPKEIAGRLGLRPDQGLVAVATEGKGVLETFMAACQAMLARAVDVADKATLERIDRSELKEQIDRAFAPHVARLSERKSRPRLAVPDCETGIVVREQDLFEEAVRTTAELGERLADETTRVGRLEREREELSGGLSRREHELEEERSRMSDYLGRRRIQLEREARARGSELEHACESQRRQEAIKARRVAELADGLSAPLGTILDAAAGVRHGKTNAATRRELMDAALEAAHRLKSGLGDLARLGRLAELSASEPPPAGDHAPESLVREAIRRSGRQGVRYTVEGLPGSLSFDLEGLSRAAANLIDNAARFSPGEAPVKVEMRGDGDDLVLSVLDRGPGVHPPDRERIFELFEQGAGARDGRPDGIGIGLHEARCLVRRHGGDLQYHPRQGGGSEFRMTVPMRTTAERALLEATGA